MRAKELKAAKTTDTAMIDSFRKGMLEDARKKAADLVREGEDIYNDPESYLPDSETGRHFILMLYNGATVREVISSIFEMYTDRAADLQYLGYPEVFKNYLYKKWLDTQDVEDSDYLGNFIRCFAKDISRMMNEAASKENDPAMSDLYRENAVYGDNIFHTIDREEFIEDVVEDIISFVSMNWRAYEELPETYRLMKMISENISWEDTAQNRLELTELIRERSDEDEWDISDEAIEEDQKIVKFDDSLWE